jgi:hypothetical protein
VAVLLIAGCGGKTDPAHEQTGSAAPSHPDAGAVDAALAMPKVDTYDDLGAALTATIPADARVIGFGELHSRTDRAKIKATLAHFTAEALPVLADKVSDLILETWVVDKGCGSAATEATAKVEITMRRPQETHNDIGDLADAARKAKIQPHAMRVTCGDYTRIAPPGKPVDTVAMLDLTTSELGRIAVEAVIHRDKEPTHRPWIALYGGALHNDRFPEPGTTDWSYAAKVDDISKNHFIEIDLIAPELAEPDPASQKQPWFPVVEHADTKVHVWKRGERSFVIVLAKATAAEKAP